MHAWSFIALVLAVAVPAASAGVVQVTSSGFLVRHETIINASPAKVYESLVDRVGSWWNPDHTYSHDTKNLSIDARPGGCFCERLGAGGIEHMRVVYVAPGEVIRMTGAMGPMQQSGLAGSLTWKVASGGLGGTKLSLTYSVGGFMEGGFEKMAPAVDGMIGEQVQRLKLFVETGSPTPRAAEKDGGGGGGY